jgi:hypothetical protein
MVEEGGNTAILIQLAFNYEIVLLLIVGSKNTPLLLMVPAWPSYKA